MLVITVLLVLLPILTSAQTQSGNVQLSTSFSTGITLGPNRAESTVTQTFVFTITPAPSSSAAPSGSASGNVTVSGNSTASGNATRSSSTSTPSNLPTAPTNIDGGGVGGVAPIPGATQGGGIYGPDDNYTAAASSLGRNAAFVGFTGFIVGMAMIYV